MIDGSNNLLELESVSGKFKELLRKIQGLKIAIYEKELCRIRKPSWNTRRNR